MHIEEMEHQRLLDNLSSMLTNLAIRLFSEKTKLERDAELSAPK